MSKTYALMREYSQALKIAPTPEGKFHNNVAMGYPERNCAPWNAWEQQLAQRWSDEGWSFDDIAKKLLRLPAAIPYKVTVKPKRGAEPDCDCTDTSALVAIDPTSWTVAVADLPQNSIVTSTSITQGTTMNTTNNIDSKIPVQTITYIFGQRVEDMDEAALIKAIGKLRAEHDSLAGLNIQSVYIDKKIKALEVSLGLVIEQLDKLA